MNSWQYKYYKLKLKLKKLLSFESTRFYKNLLKSEQKKKNYPEVISIENSLKELINSKKSITRYGDGEFLLCLGEGIDFQQKDEKLQTRLREILKATNQENCMVCIVDVHVEMKTEYSIAFWARNMYPISTLLSSGKLSYYEANIFRHLSFGQFQLIKEIWNNKDIVFVVGKDSRFVFDEDLFGNIKQHKFVYGKAKNAWSEYDTLLSDVLEVQKQFNNKAIVLVSLGPCATVLAYDLSMQNMRALDIGHISNQYQRLVKKGQKPEEINL